MIKGNDAVLTDDNDTYITTMKMALITLEFRMERRCKNESRSKVF